MIRDIVCSQTTKSDWHSLRTEIHDRIYRTMGNFPQLDCRSGIEVLSEGRIGDSSLLEFRFQSLPGTWSHGSLIRPTKEVCRGRTVICIHGTDHSLAHKNVMSPNEQPNRQYALELAQKGFTTLAVDQFGFGAGNNGRTYDETVQRFYQDYPEWSLDGARLWIHQRCLDLLPQLMDIDPNYVGCIGNSLGGRAAVYLSAFDDRIRACVASTGVSPNITNVFRNRLGPLSLSPALDRAMDNTGTPVFEYQEMLSLIAPRAVLLLEPWNDNCNPHIEPVFRCFEKCRFVFKLSECPERLQMLCHGDGHDTKDHVRQYAYDWLSSELCSA